MSSFSIVAAAAVTLALLFVNALGVGLTPQPGLYFIGLLQQLAAATVGIIRTVFVRPS